MWQDINQEVLRTQTNVCSYSKCKGHTIEGDETVSPDICIDFDPINTQIKLIDQAFSEQCLESNSKHLLDEIPG